MQTHVMYFHASMCSGILMTEVVVIPDMVESIKTGACNQLVKGCTNISYLALRGYGVADQRANILVKVCLHKIIHVDFCSLYV